MKKRELKKKLSLNKETIASLELSKITGGQKQDSNGDTCVNNTCVGSGNTGCISEEDPITCRWCDATEAYVC